MLSIAIDGPAGAGKSTIAKKLSNLLGINYMDTGAMYRAVAYALLQRGIEINDHDAVRSVLHEIHVEVVYTKEGQRVLVNGEDVTPYIRSVEVTKGSSDVAVIPEVRKMLAASQRETAEKFSIVMDGRDIGTYVLPNANIKFYITATPEERAARRQKDFQAMGIEKSIPELVEEIVARDKTDSTREFAPLKKAEDAIFIDTTEMTIDEVMEVVLANIKEVTGYGI